MTTFYFSQSVNSLAPTAGEKSAVWPDGTDNSQAFSEWTLSRSASTATPAAFSSLAQTARQSGIVNRFTSDELAAQTIGAQTWTFIGRGQESNVNANRFFGISLYVWRPSTSSVVGYIYDNVAQLSTEFTTGGGLITCTFSGSSLSINAQDVLVCEVWSTAIQAKATSYTITITYPTGSYLDATNNIAPFARKRVILIT
jgi:hypothetical protein